jgi:O-antigen ligase
MPMLALLAAWQARPTPRTVALGALPALPLLLVAAASAMWSITPAASAARAGLLVLEIGCAAMLAKSLPARALPALAASIAFAAALILGELLAGGPLTQALRGMPPEAVAAALSNGTTVVVLLMPPAAAFLWRTRHRAAAAGLVVLVAAAALAGHQLAAQAGLLGGLAGAAAALLLPGAIRAGAAMAAGVILAMPLVLPLPLALACRAVAIKLSITHRIHIWNFAEAMRRQRPWLGWGLETTRAIPGGRAHADLWTPCGVPVPPAEHLPATELLPLHTHNGAIQVWLELGPAGALAVCALLLALAWLARAPDRAGRAAQAATLAGAVVIALVSYGAWQGWWVATLALAVAACAALNPAGLSPASARHPPPPSGR